MADGYTTSQQYTKIGYVNWFLNIVLSNGNYLINKILNVQMYLYITYQIAVGNRD